MTSSAAFIGLALAFAVGMIGTTLPTPLYPDYQQAMGFSQLTITVIFAVYALGVVASLLIFGRWSDQLGRRPMLLAALALSAATDLMFLQADGLMAILAARVLSGLSAGILTTTASVAVMEAAPEGKRRAGTLAATAANMGGLGLGPIFAGVIASLLPQPLIWPYALHLLLVVVAVVFVLRANETVERKPSPDLGVQRPALPSDAASVFVPAAVAAFAGFMVCGFFTAVAPGVMTRDLNYSNPALIGLVAGILFLASTLGQAVLDRIPEKRRLPVGTAVLLAGVLVVAMALGLRMLAPLLAGAVIAGIGQGIAFRAGLAAVVGATSEDRRAATTASYFIVAYIAISLPVVGVGLLSGAIGLHVTSLVFAGLVAALCCAALVMLIRKRSVPS
ncbi:MFS transporter [Falsirhodobacter algicola]|uniref:MFS transporter n=1 Tax=Falsirhodobacter algicola TaxID=2692330 RepID=A0A8J8MT47_9RHOB|nr:MFS transporter [Falsirhodobacter algicola]QUS36241.1 MFS transporter [Falsirhodobacter algicola]